MTVSLSVSRDPARFDARDLGIALALLVSLCLHGPLLLLPGSLLVGRSPVTPTMLLELHIEAAPERAPPSAAALPDHGKAKSAALARGDVPASTGDHEDRVAESIADPGAQAPLPDASALLESISEAVTTVRDAQTDAVTAVRDAKTDAVVADRSLPEPASTGGSIHRTGVVLTTTSAAAEKALARHLLDEAQVLLASGALQRQLTIEHDRRDYAVVLDRQPASDGTGLERVTAEITTEYGGERLRTSMRLKRLAFSHFTQLVDRWDPKVLLHDDEIVGRFHSNSEIYLTYDHAAAPRLLGKVTTARDVRIIDTVGWHSRRKIFAGGLDTRTARIRLPRIALPTAGGDAEQVAEVHAVRDDASILFHADGAYDCIELDTGSGERRRLSRDRPTYITGAAGAELRVQGVVNGRVTVYSPERIVVQGDLTYAQGTSDDGVAGSYLGLVSDGNVEIDRAEVTGPGDLAIHAAVYARKRFVVRDTSARSTGTLLIHGGLAAGSVSATEPRYATRIEFDPRFEHVRPPGFPVTDRYELEAWDGRWHVAEVQE